MYEKRLLPNGVTLALDRMEGVRSVSLGVFIRAGSRCEGPGEAGAAHFIEHMLFKGSAGRTSAELAEAADELGADLNAYTSRDCTSVYARCLDTNLVGVAALLAEMLTRSRFAPEDMDTERGVILDEIRMYDDLPSDVATETLVRICFPGSLGAPVLGSPESVKAMSRETLLGFMRRRYTPGNIVLSAAGHIDDAALEPLTAALAAIPERAAPEPEPSNYTPAIAAVPRRAEQNQLLLAFPGITYAEERCTLGIMNAVLGGSGSSRLYRRLRDELGLCYDVESFDMTWAETGLFGIGAGLPPENEKRALAAITEELLRFLDEGPGESELRRARAQAEAGLVLGGESSLARMRRLGQAELFLPRVMSTDELLERYNAVTRGDVLDLARSLMDFSQLSLVSLGRPGSEAEYEKLRLLR